MTMDVSAPAPLPVSTIRPRSPRFDFDAVPRRWFARSVIGTHLANGLNLLFPAGERFFVRSVRRYLDRIEDPQLRENIKGFSGQEGLHAYAHERYFKALENQGYEIRSFLSFYETFAYGIVEKVAPAQLCLAATAACEHFTATMAANALAREADGSMVAQDPTMRALFLWHAVEEIEHRSVAFDVLQQVNPSFELRVAGLAVATSMLFGLWMIAAGSLLVQDRARPERLARELRARREFRSRHGSTEFRTAILAYLRRDFHPSQDTTCDELARAYAAAAGLS
jgi:predicted metal-dependent hydrolase